MTKNLWKLESIITLSIVCFIFTGLLIQSGLAININHIKGFDKGPSYKSVVPMEKVTFVNFDDNSLLDDYAYLAAVPTAIFEAENKLFSHPLLFYQDFYRPEDEKKLSFNARSGINYFMEDWMDYCYQLDQMTLINVDESKVNQWKSKEYTTIKGDNPFDIASKLALQDWSYSDDAVVAVIEEEFEELGHTTTTIEEGTLSSDKKIIENHKINFILL